MTPSEKQQSLDILTRRYGEQKAQVTAIDTRLAEYFDGLIAEPHFHNGAGKNSTIVKKRVSNLWKMAEKFAYMIKKQYLCTAFIIIGASLYAAGTQQQSITRPYSVAILRNIHRSPSGTPIMLKAAQYGDRFYLSPITNNLSVVMRQVQIEGIQNPVEEISSKIQQYFRQHGFKQEGQFDPMGPTNGDWSFEIHGAIDDLQVQVCYQDYKPRKLVIRDLLALDPRISNVDVYRCLSSENYRRELCEIDINVPIYVYIDGQLMQTTIYEYVQYGARNKDYTRS